MELCASLKNIVVSSLPSAMTWHLGSSEMHMRR